MKIHDFDLIEIREGADFSYDDIDSKVTIKNIGNNLFRILHVKKHLNPEVQSLLNEIERLKYSLDRAYKENADLKDTLEDFGISTDF